jgi:hypothetical protein
MTKLMIEQIERRARLEHNCDWSKAASEYFRDHPEWQRDHDDIAEVAEGARDAVNAEVRSRTEMVARRDKLDLDKAADLVAAQEKVFVEDPDLFKRYRTANTIHVGKVRSRIEGRLLQRTEYWIKH